MEIVYLLRPFLFFAGLFSFLHSYILLFLSTKVKIYHRRKEEKENSMDQKRRRSHKQPKATTTCYEEEVSSTEWEISNMSEDEEDLIYRMHKLVGDRWALIAGRIPGRKAEEIERFWIMKHGEGFSINKNN